MFIFMDFKELKKKLIFIGLNDSEAKVYLVLLKTGSSKAGNISKEASINRTSTYDILKKLMEKGLVSYVIKANHKWFSPANPSRIIELLNEKKQEANDILPYLKAVYKKPKNKQNVTLYQGYKGIKSVFEDIIRTKENNRVMDSEGQFTEKMPYYSPHFVKALNDNNIKVKHLVRKGRNIKPSKNTSVKYIDKDTTSEAVINIYGDKVAIIVWSDLPEAVVIKNKSVSDSFKYYFDLIWKKA
jgi:HTH-type transcriptional regulator, sugar sensing transcriptional regulator